MTSCFRLLLQPVDKSEAETQLMSPAPQKRWRVSPFQLGVALAGLGAIVLTVTNATPGLTMAVGLLYSFILPAVILRAYLAERFPQFQSAMTIFVLIPAFIPVWVVILSSLWIPNHSLTNDQTTVTLVVTIVMITGFLLWRMPFDIRPRADLSVGTFLANLVMLLVGLTLGLVVSVILKFFGGG